LTAIFAVGIAWGVVAFLIGLAGSFTLNSIHLVANLVGLILGLITILPITIAAIWKPKISAVLLVLSFFLFEYGVFAVEGLRTVLQVALMLGLPNIALACGYLYAASVQAKERVITQKPSG
jgi:hypothetical protein